MSVRRTGCYSLQSFLPARLVQTVTCCPPTLVDAYTCCRAQHNRASRQTGLILCKAENLTGKSRKLPKLCTSRLAAPPLRIIQHSKPVLTMPRRMFSVNASLSILSHMKQQIISGVLLVQVERPQSMFKFCSLTGSGNSGV